MANGALNLIRHFRLQSTPIERADGTYCLVFLIRGSEFGTADCDFSR